MSTCTIQVLLSRLLCKEYKEGNALLQRSFVYPAPFPLTSFRGMCKLGRCCLCIGAPLRYAHSFMQLEQESCHRANARQLSASAERHIAAPACGPACRMRSNVGGWFVLR